MLKLISGALAALILMTSAASAASLSFRVDFTGFENVRPGASGAITFLVEGLADNTAGQAASAVTIESFTFGDGTSGDLSLLSEGPVATDWTQVRLNEFTVVGGNITEIQFRANNFVPGSAGTFQDAVGIDTDDPSITFLFNQENGADFLMAARLASITPVSSIPLPAPILMLLSALAALAALARTNQSGRGSRAPRPAYA